MEVVWFYFRHHGSTAALPADDLADYIRAKAKVLLENATITFPQTKPITLNIFLAWLQINWWFQHGWIKISSFCRYTCVIFQYYTTISSWFLENVFENISPILSTKFYLWTNFFKEKYIFKIYTKYSTFFFWMPISLENCYIVRWYKGQFIKYVPYCAS